MLAFQHLPQVSSFKEQFPSPVSEMAAEASKELGAFSGRSRVVLHSLAFHILQTLYVTLIFSLLFPIIDLFWGPLSEYLFLRYRRLWEEVQWSGSKYLLSPFVSKSNPVWFLFIAWLVPVASPLTFCKTRWLYEENAKQTFLSNQRNSDLQKDFSLNQIDWMRTWLWDFKIIFCLDWFGLCLHCPECTFDLKNVLYCFILH